MVKEMSEHLTLRWQSAASNCLFGMTDQPHKSTATSTLFSHINCKKQHKILVECINSITKCTEYSLFTQHRCAMYTCAVCNECRTAGDILHYSKHSESY